MSRYNNKEKILNDLDYYKKQLDSRNVKSILHYRPKPSLSLPESFLNELTYVYEVWNFETKMYKLAFKYYGIQDHWWIIALVNGKPTDASWTIGEQVRIPTNPSSILSALGVG